MKIFFYSLLLGTLFLHPAWAVSDETAAAEKEHGIKITVDMDDDDVDKDVMTDEDMERIIKGKVFSIVSKVIDVAANELSDEEKTEIKEEIREAMQEVDDEVENEAHSIRIGSDHKGIFDDGISFLEALIPLTAIIVVFGTPIMIVAAVLYSSYRKKRLMHDTINQYVSSGKDIPPEVLKGLQKEVTPRNNLHKGVVMSGIGLGIIACFGILGGVEAAAIGLIPLFIGLAQLLIWKLEHK